MKSHTSVWLGIVVCSLAFVAMTRSARMMNRDSRDDRVNVEGSSPYRNTKPKRSRGRFIKPFSSSLRWGYQPLGFEDEGGGEGYDPDGGSVLGVIGSQCRDEFNTGISALSSPRGTDDAFLLYGPGSPASPLSWLTSSPLIRSDVKSLRVSRHTAKEGSLFSQASTGEIANIQVNDPAMDQTALQGFHNQSETTVAVFGQHVAVSFNETARGTSGSYGISSDGGATFVHKRLPAADNNGTNGGDGVVAFGPSGELYYSALAFKGTTGQNSVIVARSDDFGQTFSVVDASTTAATAPAFQDKPYMTVDARPQSPFKGNVYVSWTDFSRGPQGTFILFARSTDGGKTYGPPVPLSPQENGLALGGAFPVVGPNGDLFVVYCDLNGHHLHFSLVRSTDGGASFGSPATIFTFDPAFFVVNMLTGGAGGVRTPPFPFLAIDATGTLHLVFQARLIKPGGRDRSNVYYSRSTDSGATWVAPVQLNDDATTTSQSFPTVAVTRDGTIGVKWWDRRDDPIHDSLTGVYMTLSKDGGLTWSQNFRVTDHNWVFGPGDRGASPLYHGDYDGMCASGNNFLLSWSDERNGNGDVFFAKVPSNRDPKAADFNISAAKLYDSVVAGKSVEFQMNTNAVNGFSGDLTIGVSPAIDGLSYQTSSSTIAVGQPVTVTVSVGARVAPGPYLIDVQASAGGLTRQTNFTFTVYDPKGPAAPPVNATGTPGFTNMESGLKVDSNGTLHLVYDDDALGGEVYSTQSTDDGLTFSAPLRLTVDTDPGSPFGNEAAFSTLAIDNADNLYAAWVGRDAATQSMPIFLTLSTDHGATFSKPLPVTPPSEQPIHPIVAVDSKSGTILITYQNFVLGQSPSATLGIESLDGGKTFSSPFQISLTGEVMGNPPFCAFDQTGAAYVVYQVAGTAMDFVRIAVASDGQHFGPPKTISDPRIL
ncbi:MAG TPA: sialidase family protein, partial [Blastocatellia bacterium]|nr:sialidase family protein [Blastocatellia bacterium]